METNGTSTRERKKHTAEKAEEIRDGPIVSHSSAKRKNLLRSFASWCVALMKYVIIAVLIIAFLNYTALIKEGKVLQPKGQVLKIGDQGFHVSCIGKGKPTVILDAPAGMNSDAWTLVVPELAKLTLVCTFDRAGLGYSDRPLKPSEKSIGVEHSAERMTEDMKEIFVNQGRAERPFILVGAGLAANNGQFYAQMYPDDLAALIMVNPYHQKLFEMDNGIWEKYWFNSFLPSLQMLHFSAVAGFTRIALHLGLMKEQFAKAGVNETVIHRQRYLMCKPGHVNTAVEENFMLNASLSQLRLLHKLRQFPTNLDTTIIYSNTVSTFAPEAINKLWAKSQDDLPKTIPARTMRVISQVPADEVLLKDSRVVVDGVIQAILKTRRSASKENKY